MTNHSLSDFRSLLNLIDDYVRSGYRQDHAKEINVLPDRIRLLAALAEEVGQCKKCGLWKGRKKAVPGTGSDKPLVVVVGEGPGREEDSTGLPFVGKAGQYLDRWLAAVKIGQKQRPLTRETNTFIANIVKCRPPNNRDPLPEESEACQSYLERQIEILKPDAILSVGRISSQVLTGKPSGIGALRGKVYRYRGIALVPTYHPSAVLRNPELRAPVWEDLKLLKSLLENEST
jgi:DNA polymerase